MTPVGEKPTSSLLSAMSWLFLVGQMKRVAWEWRGEIDLAEAVAESEAAAR